MSGESLIKGGQFSIRVLGHEVVGGVTFVFGLMIGSEWVLYLFYVQGCLGWHLTKSLQPKTVMWLRGTMYLRGLGLEESNVHC